MTALLEQDTELLTADDAALRYASWHARAGAMALDVLPGVAVIATMALLAYTTPPFGALWWVFMGALGVAVLGTLVNRVVFPSMVGWSLGRAVVGIRVTTPAGGPVGGFRLLGREIAHLLDTAALFIGWLWPLWDKRHRTFADLLLRTEVRVVEDPAATPVRNVRRVAGIVLVVAALLGAAGGGLGYLQVYRHDRAVEQARVQITEQGPRIVEQLLSYGSQTVGDDFARAQTLATDAYRPLLTAQQESVRKSGITDNEYWAVSSAVLSVSTDKAAMLLALQGQRGSDAAKLRFITATVRADFEKSGDHWRVAVLTVLKKPLTGQQNQAPPPSAPPGTPPSGSGR
ncbi:MAG: Mce-associated rane protein [Mycobacterium sp.]|nr:Mce-associated rane protein [Mycobacterium sp.]